MMLSQLLFHKHKAVFFVVNNWRLLIGKVADDLSFVRKTFKW